ncbi:MAG: FHA domain-containing protein [Candidatus Promineifilaceae bacterium]
MNHSTAYAQDAPHLSTIPSTLVMGKLVIVDKNNQLVDFPLDQESITIGRARDNDIVLTDSAVSRHHIRLDRNYTGWIASDIGSTNGIVVGSQLLMAGNSASWTPHTILKLGPYNLRWERADQSAAFEMEPEMTYIESRAILHMEDEPPEIDIRNQLASVYDDQSSTLSIAVQNRRGISDSYQVELIGLPEDWVGEQSQVISLSSLEQGVVTFVVRPTMFDTMSSSEFPFSIQAASVSDPSLATATTEKLTVMPSHQFITELKETQKSFGAVSVLAIQNTGMSPDFFTVEGISQDPRVSFEARHWNMALAQHTKDNVHVGVKVENRPWLRTSEPIPYTLQVRSKSGLIRRHTSSISVQPRVNSTTLLLCLMVLVLLVVAAWGMTRLGSGVLWTPLIEQTSATIDLLSYLQM